MSPIIRVKDHSPNNGLLRSGQFETSDYRIVLPQTLLEDARRTIAGRFLLQLLAAVDYAGSGLDKRGKRVAQRPILLLGHKHRQLARHLERYLIKFVDGFTLTVSIPTRLDSEPPPITVGMVKGT